ncbi:hypothetical protein EJV46_06535 [Roseococcus sp. SYP-B2431]|uniref:HD domain-containing protein n=1 Tax=Roseococcus sp. SYP-B2431 TaxID=2496640 RepID=UPI00103B0BA9|nr:hypothetical protein [Roseococcus sp. SYP-B2431]TCI00288.1 hypothetical protein EJV46_06535 [Roseococcus sp. SYP-B2431]
MNDAQALREADEEGYARLLSALPAQAAGRVGAAMAESWRHYHARWHLGRIWRLHGDYGARDWDEDVALLAAYHDIVYRPDAPARRNEYLSAAAFLEDAAELGIRPARAGRIAGVIVATADHLGDGAAVDPATDPPGAWFLDLDLEPLAATAHAANTALIRREYAHVPDSAFASGRRAFLERLADHPWLFRTETARRLGWEQAARAHIAADLA